MKANEAPEKLYVDTEDRLSDSILYGFTEKRKDDDIEYVRKDAFIEKACEYWYQYNRDIVKKHGAKAVLGCSEFTVNVENFKKYMED